MTCRFDVDFCGQQVEQIADAIYRLRRGDVARYHYGTMIRPESPEAWLAARMMDLSDLGAVILVQRPDGLAEESPRNWSWLAVRTRARLKMRDVLELFEVDYESQ